MPDNEVDTGSHYADTVAGKILIGVAVAAGSAFISWFVSRATYVPPPPPQPVARITPTTALVQANTVVEFSAKGSSVQGAEQSIYSWRVSGLEPNKSPVARCAEKIATLSCRFALPGTFAVSIDVVDANGQYASAVSTITVSVPNGYLGLMLGSDNPNALRALLYDIDWVSLQSLVARPIVLQDPETGTPVYAAFADPPDDATDPPPWRNAAAGLKIAIPRLSPESSMAFEVALTQIGLVPVVLPFSEIYAATERGAVDLGFVSVNSPVGLAEKIARK